MKSGKVILGALAGVAIGAALGILFAPDKGTSTRKKISKKRDDVVDELEGKFNKFVDGFKKKFESMKEDVSELADDAKMKAEETAGKFSSDKK